MPLVLELAVVEVVEEQRGGHSKLDDGRDAGILGLDVLHLPAPERPAEETGHSPGGLLPASQPGAHLAEAQLGERGVRCIRREEDGSKRTQSTQCHGMKRT